MKHWNNRMVLRVAATAFLLVAAFVGWRLTERPVAVNVWRVERQVLTSQVLSTGEVRPSDRQVVMTGGLPGMFRRFDVKVGQHVEAGQRVLEVAGSNGFPGGITARFSGQVLLENPDGLDEDGNAAPLLELVTATRQVVASLSQEDAVRISAGMRAILTSEAYPNQSWTGRVVKTDAYALPTPSGGSPQVNVYIKPLKTFRVPIGYQMNVTFNLQTNSRVVVVPYTALVQEGSRYQVYVVQNGRAMAKPVSLGATANAVVEVLAGLRAGDVVVINPPSGLHRGQRVSVS